MSYSLVAFGKALALGVLMVSLSDRMSLVLGVSYLQANSFVLCAAFAAILLLSSGLFSSAKNRFVLSSCVLVGALIWSLLLFGIASGSFSSSWPMLVYASIGRLLAFVLNMQWNYYYSLSDARDNARQVAITVLLAMLIFFILSAFEGVIARTLLVIAFFSSCVLNVIVITFELHGKYNVGPRPQNHPVESQSYSITRMLYFLARVCYGIALGLLVGIVAFGNKAADLNVVLALPVAILTLVVVSCIWLTTDKSKSAVSFVVLMPLFLVAQSFIAFYPNSLVSPFGLFAALSELAWVTQNIFQLPTYRQMTGMQAGPFVFVDYGCQMVPFYLSAWSAMKLGGYFGMQESDALIEISIFLFATIVGTSSVAMLRHSVRYLPWENSRAEDSHIAEKDYSKIILAKAPKLTPREQDVLLLLVQGYSGPYIGKVLFISPETVKVHVRHIYAKIGVASKDELIEWAHDAPGSD